MEVKVKEKMNIYKVNWEEARSVFVEAKNREEAIEKVMQGEFEDDVSEETTLAPWIDVIV